MVAEVKRSRRKAGVVDRLRGQVEEVSELARDATRAIRDQAVETVGEWTRGLKEEAGRGVNARKARVASTMKLVGSAVRKGAHLLEAGKMTDAARYVDVAAESVGRA